MKRYIHTIFILLAIAVIGCTKDKSRVAPEFSELSVDATSFTLNSFEAESYTVNVKSNVEWTVSSDQSWVIPSISYGKENLTLTIQVEENIYGFERSAVVSIATVDGTQQSNITITQPAQGDITEDHYYKIPVVFHVIYKDQNNQNQYIRPGYIANLLEGVNKLYKNCGQDLKMEFVLATHSPEGKLLAEAGVDRVCWDIDKINHNAFMGYINADNIPPRYTALTWDPNRYVNIAIFTFANADVSGISYLPYTVEPHTLDGLEQLTQEQASQPLNHPYCVSINNLNIFEMTDNPYSIKNIVATIGHELGHFFGLYHTFGENANGYTRVDTDFCTDTPPYYRATYLNTVNNLLRNKTIDDLTDEQKETLLKRTNSQNTSETFISDNIMDYYYGYKNAFSAQQAERIRFVLLRSPYIPGPKMK